MNMKVTGNRISPRPAAEGASGEPQASAQRGVPDDLKAAIAPGKGRSQWLSKAEAEALIKNAATGGADATDALKTALKAGLEQGAIEGQPFLVGEAALKVVADFTGVDAAVYRARQNTDQATSANLGGGLVKTKEHVDVAEAGKSQLAIRAATQDLSPYSIIGDIVGSKLREVYDSEMSKLEAKDGGLHAAAEVVEAEISKVVQLTAAEIAKNPEALATLTGVISQIGQEGFTEALLGAGGEIAKAFSTATGLELMSADAIVDVLQKLPEMVGDLSPKAAVKLSKFADDVAVKLGVDVAAKAAKAADAAGDVAGAAGTAAKTVGKVAGVFKVIRVASAVMAGVDLFQELTAAPRSPERIAKEGINTLLQTVGVFFPVVGLGGDVLDLAWSAKLRHDDKEAGVEVTRKDTSAFVSEPSRLLASALEGAGQSTAADSFRRFADAADHVESTDGLARYEVEAFSELSRSASVEVGRAAAETPEGATRDALHGISHGFGEAFKVLYQQKKLKEDNPEKGAEMRADLLRIVGDVAKSATALAEAKGVSVESILAPTRSLVGKDDDGAEIVVEE